MYTYLTEESGASTIMLTGHIPLDICDSGATRGQHKPIGSLKKFRLRSGMLPPNVFLTVNLNACIYILGQNKSRQYFIP